MEIVLIMLFTVTLAPSAEQPAPAPIRGSVEFAWPAKYGGVIECKAFMKGASFWHPDGELNGLGNCIERQAAPVEG